MITLGNRRECFFDTFLLDEEKTTAQYLLHRPVLREKCFSFDAEWEGCGCNFFNFFYDDEIGKYRLYYLAWRTNEKGAMQNGLRACYTESDDGIHWVRPSLGIMEYNGSKDNNILLDKEHHPRLDNFFVFRDDNPACPPEERYKAILRKVNRGDPKEVHCDFALQCLVSPDGIHFQDGWPIHLHGAYDSLNVAFWDKEAQLYRCYFRWNHVPGDKTKNEKMGLGIRDIRYMESKNFKTWTEPKLLDFSDGEDIPLYTNVVQPYYRAPHIQVGFPTRYIERKEWSKCYDVLCGKEKRIVRMETEDRFGLAVTDCVFMTARGTEVFTKYDEAFIRPDAECPENWVYGDCYPFYGMIETPSVLKGADPEISLFLNMNHWMGLEYPTDVYRYTIRCDGFVSRHAGAEEKVLITKPFTYDGTEMYANLETSARGYMYFTLTSSDGEKIESCEMFGNSIDKKIGFPDGEIARFRGKEVTLQVRMLDADIYAIRFA